MFIVTSSMAGVIEKVHVFTLVLGNMGNTGLGDCPDDSECGSLFSFTCLFGGAAGDVRWRRRDGEEAERAEMRSRDSGGIE